MITSALAQATLASRFGPIELAATQHGLVAVALRTTPAAVADNVRQRFARSRTPGPERRHVDESRGAAPTWIQAGLEQLGAYLEGRRTDFDLPLDEASLSEWDRRVLDGVRTIPFGETRGYGDVARMIGSSGAARAAGGAVGRNPFALVIPCHRVIAGDGSLGGYGGSWPADRDELLSLKVELLAHEGIHVPRARRVA